MNRLKDFFPDGSDESESPLDYYVIETQHDWIHVNPETALLVNGWLDERTPPRWITFRDLHGATYRLLSATVVQVYESTAAHRASRRAFFRARKLEDRKDRRPWEEED